MGGSGFKKLFSSPFAADAIAHTCAKKWGVTKDEVKEVWDFKRDAGSSFGTCIHNLLEDQQNKKELDYSDAVSCIADIREQYNKVRVPGLNIQNARGDDRNYAMPAQKDIMRFLAMKPNDTKDHLDAIVKSFVSFSCELGFEGESVQEPMVTYLPYKMGGFVDRLLILDADKKVCRVQDYKVNGNPTERAKKHALKKEFKGIIPTRINSYTPQLNYYAFCLHKAGWTVDGLDIFARDGSWQHYEVKMWDMNELENIIKSYYEESLLEPDSKWGKNLEKYLKYNSYDS